MCQSKFSRVKKMDMNMQGGEKMMCNCPHHKMFPLFLFLLGLGYFLQAMGYLSAGFMPLAWPVLLMLAALSKMFGSMCKCCDGKGMCAL